MRTYSTAAALALFTIAAPAAYAQVAGDGSAAVGTVDDDDDFPIGLLGLLGLAGLLGLRRRDTHAGDRR